MNNIEILEEYLDKQDRKFVSEHRLMILKAIEDIIQENKELKNIIKTYDSLEGNTQNKIIVFDKSSAMINGDLFINNYIPKSKVKEIVELYDNTLQCTRKYNQDLADILCDLEELLEEGE